MSPLPRLRVVRLVPMLDFGGVETGIVVQAGLHDRARFDLRVCTFGADGRAADAVRAAGVEVDVLGTSPSLRNPRASLAVARYVSQWRPDILHASIPEADFHAALVGRLAGAARVILDGAGMPKPSLARRLVFGLLHRRVDANVAVSDALRDYLVGREFASAESVFVINSCGAPEFFQEPKSSYALAGPRFRLATVGRLVDVKNKGVLVESVGRLAAQGVSLDLVLLGDGPLRGALEAHVNALGIHDRVRIAGFVPDLVTELRAADAYALPSHSEGCSLSLIEAMAMGLPVIASRVPGNEEVTSGLDPAWLVPPTDTEAWAAAMARMIALSPTERASLGSWGRQQAVERFSPEAYVAALERLYEQIYARVDARR